MNIFGLAMILLVFGVALPLVASALYMALTVRERRLDKLANILTKQIKANKRL